MLHVFAKEVAELAERVEQEFFRIEKESRWIASLINAFIAGTAVAIVAWLVTTSEEQDGGNLLLFACLGSSAASVVFAPLAKNNSLRSIVLAYFISSAVCVLLWPVQRGTELPLAFQCFLAVSASIFFMRVCDAMHPAAVGAAMAFMIYRREIPSLLLLMLAILGLLTVVKILTYIFLEELTFRFFSREFLRDYYGQEMTLTVVNEKTR